MAATQPIRDTLDVCAFEDYYLKRGEIRNYVLVILSIYTALRISDVLRLQWDDFYDFENNCFKSHITIVEKKTGKVSTFIIHEKIISALTLYFDFAAPGRFIIENKRTKLAIGRVQAYRLISIVGEVLKFGFRVSCHSLRKILGYHAWRSGEPPAIIMQIYNHSSWAVTKRYLGITQDDLDAVFLRLSFGDTGGGLPGEVVPAGCCGMFRGCFLHELQRSCFPFMRWI